MTSSSVLARAAELRRTYGLAALCIAGGWPLDLPTTDAPFATLTLRLGWSACFLAAWALFRHGPPASWLRAVGLALPVLSAAALVALVALTGGRQSFGFLLLPTLPILVASIDPDAPEPAVATGAIVGVGGLWLLLREGAPAAVLAGFAATVSVMTVWATVAARRARRTAQIEGERAREHAESERLLAIGRLAASAAHEIRNPLAFVKANVSFVERGLPTSGELAEIAEAAGEARQGIERMETVVSDLLGLARSSGTQEPSRIEVPAAIAQAVKHVAHRARGSGVQVEVGPATGDPVVVAACGRLLQVLLNLLLNALDAVETCPADRRRVLVTPWAAGGRVRVEVADSGPGVPAGSEERVFEPFFTTKTAKGLGLGLSLCRDLVGSMGGTLRVGRSDLGGAAFVIDLPAAKQEPHPAGARLAATRA